MNVIKDEANEIMENLHSKLGMVRRGDGSFDPAWQVYGKDAIEYMVNHNMPSARQFEWPNFFIKNIIRMDLCEPNGNWKKYDVGSKYRMKKNYLWDIRFHDHDVEDMILSDVEKFEEEIVEHNGIGIVYLVAKVTKDDDFKLYEWREKFLGQSDYQKKRRQEGVQRRKLKKFFVPYWSIAIFIKPEYLDQDNDWLGIFEQGRNANDSERNPKYKLILNKIPDYVEVGRRNFNFDPEDFNEYF